MSNTTPDERFLAKVKYDKADDCWLWQGAVGRAGYGYFKLPSGKQGYAHIYSWERLHGEVPIGYEVHHVCRRRSCVNPDHLEMVTVAEHRAIHSMMRTHCSRGHPLTPDNVLPGNARRCRECEQMNKRRRRREHRVAHPLPVRGASGHLGVRERGDRWEAYGVVKRKYIYLGLYKSLDEAAHAAAAFRSEETPLPHE